MKYTLTNHWPALAAALVAASFGAVKGARAEVDPSVALAEALFQEARSLVAEERWTSACPKFAESQRLDPKLGTLLNLAHCHEKVGKWAAAWAEYTSATTLARRVGQKDREKFARERVKALEQKLSRVVVRVDAPPPGLGLRLDESPLDATALGTPLPVDPGKHVITASAPGKKSFTTEVDVPADRAELVLDIPALEPEPAPASSPPEPPPPEAAPTEPAPRAIEPPPPPPPNETKAAMAPMPPKRTKPDAPRSDPGRILMITGFSLGAAGTVVGAVTGLATLAKAREILPDCDGSRCASDRADDIATANALANVSNVGFGVAVMGIAGGIAGVLMMPRGGGEAREARVSPVIGPGVIGLRGSF